MMMDIFSAFDPHINLLIMFLPALWLMPLILMIIMMCTFWISNFPTKYFTTPSMTAMFTQSYSTTSKHLKSLTHLFVPLFMMIMVINLMGLMPYVFSNSSHLLMTISLGFPIWAALVMSGMMFSPTTFMAQLLPAGAPTWLNPFLVIIESLSTLVRPLTLSFRLAANMTAGHVVLGLIGSYLTSSLLMSSMSLSTVLVLMIQTGYIMFEFGICLIQAYIFCLLLTLYSDDHPTP